MDAFRLLIRAAVAFGGLVVTVVVAGCVSVPLPQLVPETAATTRVTTFNMRFVDHSAEDPHERGAAVADYLRETDADLILLQEMVTIDGYEIVRPDPLAAVLHDLLPAYGWIRPTGVALLSGSNPILYRRDRYLPLEQGVVWMSDHPDIPDSRSWGNDIPRYATWALFYDNAGPAHLFVVNVHLDHLSEYTNERAIDVIRGLLSRKADALPAVLGGDFNAVPGSSVRARLDYILVSALRWHEGPTHRSFPRLQIDGLYFSRDVSVIEVRIDETPLAKPVSSDHAAVIADVLLAVGGERR